MRQLWEYLDDEMPRGDAACMRHHLSHCPTCGPHAVFEQRLLDRIAAMRPECGDVAAVRRRIMAILALQRILPNWKDG
jgi:hypothetical protein